MRIDVKWIDVTENLKTGDQPVLFLERNLAHGDDERGKLFAVAKVARVGTFWVPQSPLAGSGEVKWSMTKSGDHVRIPVEAYRTTTRSLSAIFAMGIEIGMRAVTALNERVRGSVSPTVVTLVLGHEIIDLPDDNAFRCFVGIAIRVD